MKQCWLVCFSDIAFNNGIVLSGSLYFFAWTQSLCSILFCSHGFTKETDDRLFQRWDPLPVPTPCCPTSFINCRSFNLLFIFFGLTLSLTQDDSREWALCSSFAIPWSFAFWNHFSTLDGKILCLWVMRGVEDPSVSLVTHLFLCYVIFLFHRNCRLSGLGRTKKWSSHFTNEKRA